MAYDDSFYRAYAAYLQEDSVRRAHDRVLSMVRTLPAFRNVVDLGCGQFNEFLHYRKPQRYVGLDVNVKPRRSKNRKLLEGNYRNFDLVAKAVAEHDVTAFVSLFSSEITAPSAENYAYYQRLFDALPSIQAGLVGGFYYHRSKDKNPIGEAGGIMSYQTLEPIEDVVNPAFHETRILLAAPSAMFGDDVIEVWKLFERK
jgi:hypothetical protein